MPFNRPQPVHPVVVAASVAGLGSPISIPASTPSNRLHHGQQCPRYRRACHRLTFMAKSLQETVGVLGPLGSPIKLTCEIALSLAQALEGMLFNRQMCTEIADLVTRYLITIREELNEAAKGDTRFKSLVDDYAETLREVLHGVTLIAHRHRFSHLVYHHSESEELHGFKAKLDNAFQTLMLRCVLQIRQMQGHVVTDQQRIVENQHQHSNILAATDRRLESVLEKFGSIDQLLS